MRQITPLALLSIALSACSLKPAYYRPEMDIPTAYKETVKWTPTRLTYDGADRGPWWEVYEDMELNALQEKLANSNQNLKAALARYQQARALAAAAHADYFPQVTGNTDGQRWKESGNIANPLSVKNFNDFLVGADISYELDVWGKIKNLVAAADNRACASAADLATMNLSLHAELASNYFTLRGNEEAQRILDETVKVYKKALYLTRKRHEGGAAPEADVDQVQTQLKTAETLANDLRLQRSQLEHAIAVLIGESPSTFTLPVAPHKMKLISIETSIPSTLLERRPDIIAAEQRMQAANADIGVANAAFYPDFNLLGSVGYESQFLPKLIRIPSLFWSVGPSAALKLFDGGRIQAFVEKAEASYFETVSNYRQTVLVAFQEVEDNLVAINRLNQEIETQTEAVNSANRSLRQANFRYRGGIITYLDIVDIQNTALQAELANINIRTRRQIASVQLIKAIGGGWRFKAEF